MIDKSALADWIRALSASKMLQESPDITLASLIDELADAHRERPALIGEREQLSYRQLAARANQYARWAIAKGLSKGTVVGLLMPNCPDYVAIWMGLTRAGCIVALINTNLRADALLHSVKVAGAKHLIIDEALIQAVPDWLPDNVGISVHRDGAPGPEAAQFCEARLDPTECALPASLDRALLIYTSGTTGMPKAVNVTHARIAEWSVWFAGMMDTQPNDRLYNCLPMYHSVGGIVAVGSMLIRGGSVVIRERFSVSRFWDDVVETDCSIFLYIGELCRYLTKAPPQPRQRQHRLRLACGNGLHGDVWRNFQKRFNVPRILEFYAATEGVVSLYNCEGKPGAIGRVPSFLAHRFAVTLVRNDLDSLEPVRDAAGFCIACGVDETGEAIRQVRGFDGYTDGAASARKVLTGVFEPGDRWFRTGDLMRKDAAGYFYFVDRIGDTFRWRGENVATTEVASVIRACPGVSDAVVYGVSVSGNEGRAGMAAVVTDRDFDLATLWGHLASHLPHYGRPLFLRLCDQLEVTGTFKLPKGKLAEEGFTHSGDPVWFNDRAAGGFIPCDEALVREINDGTRRF